MLASSLGLDRVVKDRAVEINRFYTQVGRLDRIWNLVVEEEMWGGRKRAHP